LETPVNRINVAFVLEAAVENVYKSNLYLSKSTSTRANRPGKSWMDDTVTPRVTERRRNEKMAATDAVNILMCTNALFQQHAAVCLASLLTNNPDFFFNVVIVGRTTEELDEEKLQRSLTRFANASLTFRKFAPPADLLLPLSPGAHYTIDTYTRVWLAEFFAETVDRVLYLDADIVVVGSIASLWSTDLVGALMGAVDIPGSDQGVTRLGMRAEDGYFNAGVLLIDLARWRATKAEQTIIDYIQAYPERLEYDQDALNACFYRVTKRLDYKWNVIRPFFREPLALPLERSEIEAIRREALIIHFNGGSKPWSYFCDHPRRDEYEKYLRMTEWRDYVPPDRTPLNRLRKVMSSILPNSVKGLVKTVVAMLGARRRPVGAA
jgi:lipopolysaccharide biosynthesis glycosyltransferase